MFEANFDVNKGKNFHVFMLLSVVRLSCLTHLRQYETRSILLLSVGCKTAASPHFFPLLLLFPFASPFLFNLLIVLCRKELQHTQLASLKQLKEIGDVFGLAKHPGHWSWRCWAAQSCAFCVQRPKVSQSAASKMKFLQSCVF